MTDDNMSRFDPEHLMRWWETTRHYWFANLDSLFEATSETEENWLPAQLDSDGQKRFLSGVRGRLLRSVKHRGEHNALRELESAFQQQITLIAKHPEVPRRLWSWLAQDSDPDLQRRVRTLIAFYVSRLAKIIARAKQQGLVGANIKPDTAAIVLVGLVQGLVFKEHAAPPTKEWFVREAAKAWIHYRAALTSSFGVERLTY